MRDAQRAKRHAKTEASFAKSRLIDILKTLENTPGCMTEANRLSSIIARLEAWQVA
jgi:hypothetical protein